MEKKNSKRVFKFLFIISILIISFNTVSANQWTVGPGKDYSSIQEAVNNVNTHDNDVINVYGGTYKEDVKVNKKLTIRVVKGNVVILKPSKTGFSIVNDLTGAGTGSKISGFKIVCYSMGTAFNVTVNNCIIQNNRIFGGKTGIMSYGNNTFIYHNVISKVYNNSIQIGDSSIINSSGTPKLIINAPKYSIIRNNWINRGITGIAVVGDHILITGNRIHQATKHGIALWGSYSTVVGNKILYMIGKGSKFGILQGTLGMKNSTGLTVANNLLYNIKSLDKETKGFELFAMTMNANLDLIKIKGNTFSSLYGATKATAISMVGLALSGKMSGIRVNNNKITNLHSHQTNATSTGISLVSLVLTDKKTDTAGKLALSGNVIYNLYSKGANSKSTGLSFVGVCGGNATISRNKLSKLFAEKSATGISFAGVDYTNLESNLLIQKNKISHIKAHKVSSAIQGISLGNINILHNNILRINSGITKSIVTMSIGQTNILGNNLEGYGSGDGIAVKGRHVTISYNRIVNFEHFIQNLNILEFNAFGEGMTGKQFEKNMEEYLISQKVPKDKIPVIMANWLKFMAIQDKIIGSSTNAPYNWYGTNYPSSSKFTGAGTLNYNPWLVLRIWANPSTLYPGQNSTVTAHVYYDSNGVNHSINALKYFSGNILTFSTDLGDMFHGNRTSKIIWVQWVNGLAQATFLADEGSGIATVTAKDYQIVKTYINIIGESYTTIGMQETGSTINYLLLAILMFMGGIFVSIKK